MKPALVSCTCLVAVACHRDSISCEGAGHLVSTRLYPNRVDIACAQTIIASHARTPGSGQVTYDWQHYIELVQRKPGALRNGTPFLEWDLPQAIRTVRDRVLKQPKGDRAFVELLLMAREVGLEPLQVACELTLESGVITGAVVMNELRRLTAPSRPDSLDLPDRLQLQAEPLADCARYDQLRGGAHVLH